MKKLVLVLLLGMLAVGAAFADHPQDKLGIGPVWRGGFGPSNWWDIGLSLKVPSVPIFWSINVRPGSGYLILGATGDFYFKDDSIIAKEMTNEDGTYNFRLDWYFGLGAYLSLGFWNDYMAATFGLRVPIGLSWHIISSIEMFLGAAPSLGISTRGDLFHWGLPVEVGFRFWL
jgi:hypothetical protein